MSKKEIKEKIKKCKVHKKNITYYNEQLKNQYKKGLISYKEYNRRLNEFLKNKNAKEWHDYYDKEILRLEIELKQFKLNKFVLPIVLVLLAIVVVGINLNLFTLRLPETEASVFEKPALIELSNKEVYQNEKLTILFNPTSSGIYKEVYFYKGNNLMDKKLLNCEDVTCYDQKMLQYIIPEDWVGRYSVNVFDYSSNDYVKEEFNVKAKESGQVKFDRDLDCHKCGKHKAPPNSIINMSISAGKLGMLEDYYPSSWQLINENNGIVESVNESYNKVSWNNKDKSWYLIKSPERTTPSTKYEFYSKLDNEYSEPWMVVVADPASFGVLNVTLLSPSQNEIIINQNELFWLNASVTYLAGSEPIARNVMGVARENITSVRPDKDINKSSYSKPFYVKRLVAPSVKQRPTTNRSYYSGSAGYDYARDVAIDSQDNYIVVGDNSTQQNWYIEKIARDNSSSIPHTYNYGVGSTDLSYSVAVDKNDDIFVAGRSNNDWRVEKLDKNNINNVLDVYIYDSKKGTDIARAIAIDSQQNVIVGGTVYNVNNNWSIRKLNPNMDDPPMATYTDKIDYGNDNLNDLVIDSQDNVIAVGDLNNNDWRILRLDPSLNIIWEKIFTTPQTDVLYGVAIDSQDNIIAVGSGKSSLDCVITKWNKDGASIWNYTYDSGLGSDYCRGIDVDSNDNIIVSAVKVGVSDRDWYVIKLDKDKNLLWEFNYNYGGSDIARSVAVDSSDDFIVVGEGGAAQRMYIRKFTTFKNPSYCGDLTNLGKCKLGWLVNASGLGTWQLDALFNSTTSGVDVNTTENVNVTILLTGEEFVGRPWFNESNNNDTTPIYGQYMNLSIRINDNIGLNKYIFSTNDSGVWENDTWLYAGIKPSIIDYQLKTFYCASRCPVYCGSGYSCSIADNKFNSGLKMYSSGSCSGCRSMPKCRAIGGRLGAAYILKIPLKDIAYPSNAKLKVFTTNTTGTISVYHININDDYCSYSHPGYDSGTYPITVNADNIIDVDVTEHLQGAINNNEDMIAFLLNVDNTISSNMNITNAYIVADSILSVRDWKLLKTMLPKGKGGWAYYANDSDSNLNKSSVETYVVGDSVMPSFSRYYTNSSVLLPNEHVNISIRIEDNYDIHDYIFSWNNSGSWSNDTKVMLNGIQTYYDNWTIKQVSSGNGHRISWMYYANDSSHNVDYSLVKGIYVDNKPTHDWPILNSSKGRNKTSEDLIAWNKSNADVDNDAVFSIFHWYKNDTSFEQLIMPFDDLREKIKDYSYFKLDGVGNNVVFAKNESCRLSGCYMFDTRRSSINISDNKALDLSQALTIEAWIYPKRLPDNDYSAILTKGSGSGKENYALYTWINDLYFEITDGFGTYDGMQTFNSPLGLNRWQHVAVTFNDTNDEIKLYVNGSNYGNGTMNTLNLENGINDYSLMIGADKDYLVYSFNGSIDEVRLYNRTLSPEQIRMHYQLMYNMISHNETNVGDEFIVEVTPNDQFMDGESKNSTGLVIVDILPVELVFVDPYDKVDFGNRNLNEEADTETGPTPFLLRNDGSSNIDVEIDSTGLWLSSNGYYRYKINDPLTIPPGQVDGCAPTINDCFDEDNSVMAWTNMPICSDGSCKELAIKSLYNNNANDEARVDIRIKVPGDEPSGPKTATVTFTASISS